MKVGRCFPNCVDVFTAIPGMLCNLAIISSVFVPCKFTMVGSASNIACSRFTPNPRPNRLLACINSASDASPSLVSMFVRILVASFSLKPSTSKKSSWVILMILGIVSKPALMILRACPVLNPSTPIFRKNPAIFFSLTTESSSGFFKIMSTCVGFHS